MKKCMACGCVYKASGVNPLLFCILFLFGIFPAVIYWGMKRKSKCPMCKCKN